LDGHVVLLFGRGCGSVWLLRYVVGRVVWEAGGRGPRRLPLAGCPGRSDGEGGQVLPHSPELSLSGPGWGGWGPTWSRNGGHAPNDGSVHQ